jgi:hypothetical protein
VKFDDGTEEALSPQRHLDRLTTPLIVAYGSFETPEFQRQSRDFAAAVKDAGKPVELIRGEGYNHFEFIETLGNPCVQPAGLRRPGPDETGRAVVCCPNSEVSWTAVNFSAKGKGVLVYDLGSADNVRDDGADFRSGFSRGGGAVARLRLL